MNLPLDPQKLGAGLLAAGPLLLQFGGSKISWWAGLAATVIGPVLMALRKGK